MSDDRDLKQGLMRWFGLHPWSQHCKAATQTPTPVGLPCIHCEEAIVLGDEGISIPHMTLLPASMTWVYFHKECFFRTIFGSVGHQLGICDCGNQEDTSEDGMTRREAAIASYEHYNNGTKPPPPTIN